MVKEIQEKGKTLYICSECGFGYDQKEMAEKCQSFCKEHNGCSLEITKHAVKTS